MLLDEVPDIGKACDCARRQRSRDYARDAARVEDARRIIFDHGMSVGGELEILKAGSLVPTRVICSPTIFGHWLTRSRMHIIQNLVPIQQSSCRLTFFTTGNSALEKLYVHTTSGYSRQSVELRSTRSMHGKLLEPHTGLRWLICMYRFRQVPTFGRDTIRKFGGNVSAMKKLAGRDFEDILQVGALLPS